VVQRFVDASMEGWRHYLADPALVDAELQRLNPAMNPEQMRFSVATLKEHHFIDGEGTEASHLGHMTADRWATTYRQLEELKVTTHTIDPATAYTTRFAP
jgi:NitT/TauT family transport system substrate-binding protein